MKSSREQFEEWAEDVGALPWGYLKKQRTPGGGCSVQIYNYMWSAWQASREAIEIELPDITDAQYQSKHIEGGFRSEAFWLQVRKCIENVGLKVKS